MSPWKPNTYRMLRSTTPRSNCPASDDLSDCNAYVILTTCPSASCELDVQGTYSAHEKSRQSRPYSDCAATQFCLLSAGSDLHEHWRSLTKFEGLSLDISIATRSKSNDDRPSHGEYMISGHRKCFPERGDDHVANVMTLGRSVSRAPQTSLNTQPSPLDLSQPSLMDSLRSTPGKSSIL